MWYNQFDFSPKFLGLLKKIPQLNEVLIVDYEVLFDAKKIILLFDVELKDADSQTVLTVLVSLYGVSAFNFKSKTTNVLKVRFWLQNQMVKYI